MNEILSMVKGDERFIFRYRRGEEDLLSKQLAVCAADEKSSFDWSDAVMMSIQICDRLGAQLRLGLEQLEVER